MLCEQDKTSLKRISEADRAEFEKNIGKVAFEFTSRNIDELHEWELSPHGRFEEFEQGRLNMFLKDSCLAINEIWIYRQKLPYYKPLYGYHIAALKIYDKPKELSEFCRPCTFAAGCYLCDESGFALDGNIDCFNRIKRAPQSWCYVEEIY